MKPIQFPEMTKMLRRPEGWTNDECAPLPVFENGIESISCWALTWRERFRVLVTGRVWLGVASGYSQPPVFLSAKVPHFTPPEDPTR